MRWTHLKYHGDADEREHGGVEGVLLRPYLQDLLQLRRVGCEQGHVHHALRDSLLRRIAVCVEGLVREEISTEYQ